MTAPKAQRPFLTGLLMGALSALAFALSFPSAFIWPLAFLVLAPLIHAAQRTSSPRRTALAVYLAWLPAWGYLHQFALTSSAAGFFPLVAYISIYPAAFVCILARLRARFEHRPKLLAMLIAPLLWTGLEVLRGEIIWHGYPWFLLGQPLIQWPPIYGLAPWFGVYSATLAATMVSGALAALRFGRVLTAAQPARGLHSDERSTPTPRPEGPKGCSHGCSEPPTGASGTRGPSGSPAKEPRRGEGAPTVFVGEPNRSWAKKNLVPLLVVSLIALNPIAANRTGFGVEEGIVQSLGRRHAQVAVIQTNVPQSIKNEWTFDKAAADFARFLDLSREAASADPKPDLIVWPETMFPGMALNAEAIAAMRESKLGFKGANAPLTIFHDALMQFQQEIAVPMLVGAEAIDGLKFIPQPDDSVKVETAARYNSAFLITHGEVGPQRYDKIHLTPFGEVMPYISDWPWLEKQLLALGAHGMTFDLQPGTTRTVFAIPRATDLGSARATDVGSATSVPSDPAAHPALRIVTPICYEAAVQDVCRNLVFDDTTADRRADLMVCLTNDGWFYNWDGGHENHLLFARWRCLELRTPMVRAANTGISCLIDAHGRVIERRPDRRNKNGTNEPVEGILNLHILLPHADQGATPFARLGNWLGWAALAAAVILSLLACVPAKPRTLAQPPTSTSPEATK